MKHIIIFMQTVIFLFALSIPVWCRNFDCLAVLLLTQIVMATIQLVASVFSLLTKAGRHSVRSYLLGVGLYIAVLLLIFSINDVPEHWKTILLTVPAWSLAIYYYYISWKTVTVRKPQSRFLPHINF